MRENRSSCNQISYVLILWLDLVFLLIFFVPPAFCTSYKRFQPVPAVHIQFINVFFDLGSFESKPFGKHKAHPSPNAVCPYSFQISVPFNLSFLCRVSVYADRAVLDNHADFIFRRSVLKACNPLVKQDLFDISFHFFLSWLITVNSDSTPHIVANEHRESLGSPSCAPNRTGIKDPDILRTIVIFPQVDLVDSLNRRCNYPLCENGHRNPDCSFNCILFCRKASNFTFCDLAPDFKSSLFPGHFNLKFPDLCSNSSYTYKILDSICKILSKGNFHKGFRISSTGPGFIRNFYCVFKPLFKSIEVFMHFLACNCFTHVKSPFKEQT